MSKTVEAVLNRLCKWRTIFAGWQLGTRPNDDPECQAVRDHRDATMLLRIEMSAISALLISAGVITRDEFNRQLIEEAEALMAMYERRWPGAKSTDAGMQLDARAQEWLAKFPR